jgi:GNAT superfamily N-acetyltransferase
LLTRFFAGEGFATPPEAIAANVARMAGLEACALLLARVDSEPAGVATVSLDFGIEYGWSAEMGDLYVDPRFRGRGVARSLMAAAEVFCRARGVSGLGVTVTAKPKPATASPASTRPSASPAKAAGFCGGTWGEKGGGPPASVVEEAPELP